MALWDWWWGALALGSLPIVHWLLLGRGLAVSGRITALVDRVRFGGQDEDPDDGADGEFDQAALLEALRAQTAEAFGDDALELPPSLPPAAAPAAVRAPERSSTHLCFLGGLVLGGFASALLAGGFAPMAGLRGELFARATSELPLPAPVALVLGGVLVGFGTRMAGGCTSGHGLCGVSRFQPGSLVATAAFFGAGIATSFLLEAWL